MTCIKKIILAPALIALAFQGYGFADEYDNDSHSRMELVEAIRRSDVAMVEKVLAKETYTQSEYDSLIDEADKYVLEKNFLQRSGWNWFKFIFLGISGVACVPKLISFRSTAAEDSFNWQVYRTGNFLEDLPEEAPADNVEVQQFLEVARCSPLKKVGYAVMTAAFLGMGFHGFYSPYLIYKKAKRIANAIRAAKARAQHA